MICFPNAKINLGLRITEKRADGYHNLQSLMLPSGPYDMLEFVEAEEDSLSLSGNIPEIPAEDNIVMKALKLMRKSHPLPPLHVHLHKNIPSGAGLGGGSSDAAFMLKMLNTSFDLSLSQEKLTEMAAGLGSDCPFFILNKPAFAFGRGDILEEVKESGQKFYLQIFNPGIHISTAEAFSGINPQKPESDIRLMSLKNPESWKQELNNDFEKILFLKYPLLREIKEILYANGAFYASVSGSGSSVYGIYREKFSIPLQISSFQCWDGYIYV